MEEREATIRARHPDLATKKFGCGPGWLPILAAYFDEVAGILADRPIPDYELLQVKQKSGLLQIDFRVGDGKQPLTLDTQSFREAECRKLIQLAADRAASLSRVTCGVCGQLGILRRNGSSYSTTCQVHADGAVPVIGIGGEEIKNDDD